MKRLIIAVLTAFMAWPVMAQEDDFTWGGVKSKVMETIKQNA